MKQKRFLSRLVVRLLVMALVVFLAVPVMAQEEFDWESAIESFQPDAFNDHTLQVGDKVTPSEATFLSVTKGTCYSSNEAVVVVTSSGDVVAEGVGEAYVAIALETGNVYLHHYTVQKAAAVEEDLLTIGALTTGSNYEAEYNKTKRQMDIWFSIFPVLFLGTLALVIFSVIKSRALDEAMRRVGENPTQENADAAVKEFSHVNVIVRWVLRNGSDSKGVHFSMWRAVFNNNVVPSRNIRPETKEALRNAMIRLNTYGLRHVYTPKQ